MDYDYDKLLDRAWGMLPEKLKSHERFEVPEVVAFVEGQTTIIKNFNEIASAFNREPSHIMRFLSKELAAPGSIKGDELLLQGKISPVIIRQRIEEYAKEFVICQECGKPDTNLIKSDRLSALKCEACGAKKAMRTI